MTRSRKKLREEGLEGFMGQKKGRRGGCVLTPRVLSEAQQLLNQGYSRREIADELEVGYDTLRKAISSGRL